MCPHCKLLLVEAGSRVGREPRHRGEHRRRARRHADLEQLRRPRVPERDLLRVLLPAPRRGGDRQQRRHRLRRGVPGRVRLRHRGGRHLAAARRQRARLVRDGLVRAPAAAAPPTSPSRPGRPTPAARRRSVADVSAVADPGTGVAVYDSDGAGGWGVYGGTSAAAPIVAGVLRAGRRRGRGGPASYPYENPGLFHDVTSGGNGTCSLAYLCNGRARLRRPDRRRHAERRRRDGSTTQSARPPHAHRDRSRA